MTGALTFNGTRYINGYVDGPRYERLGVGIARVRTHTPQPGWCRGCNQGHLETVMSDEYAPRSWLVVRLCLNCWADAEQYCLSFDFHVTGDRLHQWFLRRAS